jgi:hypothetical protein
MIVMENLPPVLQAFVGREESRAATQIPAIHDAIEHVGRIIDIGALHCREKAAANRCSASISLGSKAHLRVPRGRQTPLGRSVQRGPR